MLSQLVVRGGGLARALPFALFLAVSPLAISAGAPGLALVSAQARENVQIPSVTVSGELGTLVLKNVAATGSSLNRAELQAVLEGAGPGSLSERFARLDADTLTIEALEWRMTMNQQENRTVYHAIEASDVRKGLASRITLRGADIEGKVLADGKSQPLTGRIGPIAIETMDIAHMLRWATEADTSGKAEMKPVHGAYVLDFYEITTPDTKIRFDRMSSAGMKAKVMPTSMAGFIQMAAAAEANKGDTAAAARMFGAILDMLTSFELGETRIAGVSANGKSPDGQSLEMKLGPITFGGGAPGGRLDGLDIKADDGLIRIRSITTEGDLPGALAAVMKTIAPDEAGLADRPLPALGAYGFAVEGLQADVPDSNRPTRNGVAERMKFTLESFDTRTSNYIGVNPADIALTLKKFTLPIPADTADDGLKELRAAGIDTIDLSARIEGRWEQAANAYRIQEVTIDLGGIAKATLTGNLGNITRGIFDGPSEARMLAALAGNIQNATLTLTNLGGAEKILAKVARDQRKKPEQLKTEVGFMGPAMIGMFLSDHPDAKALGEAIGKFLGSFGTLTIKARAADSGGITAADFVAAANPLDVLKKVRIEATAN